MVKLRALSRPGAARLIQLTEEREEICRAATAFIVAVEENGYSSAAACAAVGPLRRAVNIRMERIVREAL